MLLFNPIRLRDRLVEAGVMTHLQAETFATAISESDVVELATKSDIAELRSEFAQLRAEFSQLQANFARLEARLMRWMLGGAALGGLIGGMAAGLLK